MFGEEQQLVVQEIVAGVGVGVAQVWDEYLHALQKADGVLEHLGKK